MALSFATLEGSCDGSFVSHLYAIDGTSGLSGELAREHHGSGPLNALFAFP